MIEGPGVVLTNPKYPQNLGMVIRACVNFGIPQLRWTGDRIRIPEISTRLPREERMKEYNERLTWKPSERPTDELAGPIITVEFDAAAIDLCQFEHPAQAIYFFGPEDGNVPKWVRHLSHYFVRIPSTHCLNLAAAVNVVLYDRVMKDKTCSW